MRKAWLWLEFTFFFVILPFILFVYRFRLKRLIIPTLFAAFVVFMTILIRDKTFDRSHLWLPDGFLKHLIPVLLRFLFGGITLYLLVANLESHLLFNFMRSQPRIWLMVMCLYPLLSVYPQEIIYRAYFFHRYRPLFPSSRAMIIASGLSFGLVHIFFFNVWALTLSTVGGFMFAWTYHRSGSILFSSIEHGLWGDFIFTVGLGLYFYSGAISAS